jgi:hypothetical protein
MSPHVAFRPRSLLRALTIVTVALAPAPAAHASPQTQNLSATESQTAAPPKTLQPRGYDPYYRIPAATPAPATRHDTHSTTNNPSTRSIAISIAITLTVLTAIATHVRRTRTRRRRTRRALA